MTGNYSLVKKDLPKIFSVPKIRHYSSFKAFQFTLRELSETPISNLSEFSLQSQLCASRYFVISLSTAMKSGEQVVWGPARLSQHADPSPDFHGTNKICPSAKTSCGKGEKDREKSDLWTCLSVKIPQRNHAGS